MKKPTVPEIDANILALMEAITPKIYRGKHTKRCECIHCMKAKLADYRARATMAIRGGARPQSSDQTVPVRAHWRKQKAHLAKDPELRKLVMEIVRELLAEQKKNLS